MYEFSSTYWIWAQGANDGMAGDPAGVVRRDDAGVIVREDDGHVLEHLTRPYAMAVGGDVDETRWDGTSLTVRFHQRPGVPATHDVYWSRGQPTVTCDGAALAGVTGDPTTQIFSVVCGGGASEDAGAAHALVFAP